MGPDRPKERLTSDGLVDAIASRIVLVQTMEPGWLRHRYWDPTG